MELDDVPRHRPLAFDKMESLIKEMQDPETGVPVRSQKLFLSCIPAAFMGYDLVEWLMERFNLDETSNVEAINLANQLCQYGYFFPVNDSKNLILKDDSSLYRFQSPYYWPWQAPRVSGSGSLTPSLGPDNVEYAIYLVKRTLRNKQRHGLEDYELEALANLKKNLAAKWDFINMQAEEQVRLAKDRKKGDKIVSDSQERAYWRVARPPPGLASALEHCPVPVRARHPRSRKRTALQLQREIEHLKASLDRTRVKTSIALEALMAYSETFAPYDPWLTPPQPSNPWVSDDTLYWQINSPLVDVPSEKRVQRWALSMEELVSDPTGLQEFTSFLRKEYSHENIRFWLAVMDLRRSSTKQIPKKLEQIYEEFLKPSAPCEINIDGATADRVAEGLRAGSRYALDEAADHVYGLLLKKDCYPRFVRSDHFQRLLAEGKNVHQKKAKFFNFGGQVKKKPGSTSGSGSSGALSRRRGSDRSLSGSAHELAICAAQVTRAPEPPPHSHSQSNLADIPAFRDPGDTCAEVAPWETGVHAAVTSARRRQDSAADSGSSSSDVSACTERRRLPQQSTLDGGLRGAPPPLRRLSAVEPRHLAPPPSPPAAPRPAPPVAPPHPTPTISVSSAPDDSPDEQPPSDEPSSVFASADATPTEPYRAPFRSLEDDDSVGVEFQNTVSFDSCDDSRTDCVVSEVEVRVQSVSETSSAPSAPADERRDFHAPAVRSDSKDSDKTKSSTDDVVSVRRTLSREPSTIREMSPASNDDISSEIGDLPENPREMVVKLPSLPTDSASEPPVPTSISPLKSQITLPQTDAAMIDLTPALLQPATPSKAKEIKESTVPMADKVLPPSLTQKADSDKTQETKSVIKQVAGQVKPQMMQSALPRVAEHGELLVVKSSTSHIADSTATPAVVPPPAASTSGASGVSGSRPPVAPLAECEDIGVDDVHVDKVPSAPLQRVSGDSKAVSESDATKRIAHKDEKTSVSESNIVKVDSKSDAGARKQRNDICPWEDENSCESEAPFVKTYATLGYL